MKFDKVIMNPPFSIGGNILDKAKTVSKNIICLMPLAQYKKYKRYRYIASFEIADKSLFDADITGNLCITTNQSFDNGKSYEDFLFDSFNQNYIKFYEWNRKNDKGLFLVEKKNKLYTDFDIDLDFAVGSRALKQVHCISTTGKGFDYYWNVLREGYEDKWAISGVIIIHFPSKKARNNFTEFVYSKVGDSFISGFIRGLNLISASSYSSYAIPQIDWEKISSHPLWKKGRYDEAVLDTMGLKWEGEKIVEVQ